ncbi:hypothetical protein AVEN_237344-1 [Araneus ventricosus]|uniref:Tc3 transposase DNA binding domain-containing protein n=1 Tax=Araneus ventricosus TaxID=182803 RepID=A0A4Y2W458_ARAVE|nr:hypothetical protein AVEN_212139-1 [Araneus ventricosus]GBO32159.1 hypothetical protein AVEN_237344-1 [Araneus ventricosus]
MAGQYLSDFQCGVIDGAREIGHSKFEVAMEFGFSLTTISRVYREYRVSADFNDGASTSVSVRIVQRTVINMGFRPTRVPLLPARQKPLSLAPGPNNTTIRLLMTGNTLPGLTSLVSNCIGRIHAYKYRDNLINPYTLFDNRRLFNLVEPL